MSTFATAGFAVFILILFAGIYLTLFGLPGTIIIFFDVLLYALFTGFARIGWKALLFLLVFSIFAETIDILIGMTGAPRTPVLKKSFWAAAIGAIAGTMILTPFLWGLGTWTGFFLGGLAGIMTIEFFRQSTLRTPFQDSNHTIIAMFGRKMIKGVFALIMIAVSLSNIYS